VLPSWAIAPQRYCPLHRYHLAVWPPRQVGVNCKKGKYVIQKTSRRAIVLALLHRPSRLQALLPQLGHRTQVDAECTVLCRVARVP
jgi:hypothetical protein